MAIPEVPSVPAVPAMPEIPAMPEMPVLDIPAVPSLDGLTLPNDMALPEVKLPDLAGQLPVPDLSALPVPEMPAGLNLPPGLTLPEGFVLPPGTPVPEFSDAAAAQQWMQVLAKTAPPAG